MPGGVRERQVLRTPSTFSARVTGEGWRLCHSPRGTTRGADMDYWPKELRLLLSHMIISTWLLN